MFYPRSSFITQYWGKGKEMKMKFFTLSITSLLCSFSMQASAQALNYNYLEAGFSTLEFDAGPLDVDGDGFDIGVSFDITDVLYIKAVVADTEYDFNIDSSEVKAGLGAHTSLNEQTDLYGVFSLIDAEIGANDESGYGFEVGIRHLLNSQVELEGGFGYQDVYDDSGSSLSFGGRYYFTNRLSGAINYTNTEVDDDDITGLRLSVRYSF